MPRTVLVTGSTDGIGLEAARRLAADGHHVLLHGRDPAKLESALADVRAVATGGGVDGLLADLSSLDDVGALADAVAERVDHLDVLVNNAGVLRTSSPRTVDGLDVRFVVNTIAPYLLTRRLLPLLGASGRVVNLSSAAQSPVDLDAMEGRGDLDAMAAYGQSKLAITMWSRSLADELGRDGPVVVAVNPGSLLATKMVREGFGIAGNDIGIGADVVVRAALSDEFAAASGRYYDNDAGRFGDPHRDALDPERVREVTGRVHALAGLAQGA